MDSPAGSRAWHRLNQDPTNCQFHHHHPHHHHHFFNVSPHCPLHGYMLHTTTHSPNCPLFTGWHPLPQNPQPLSSVPLPKAPNLPLSESTEACPDALVMYEANEVLEEEEEEEGDPVFVLTDEWREFFAKSEAKRRLAKKQAKKKGKS